MSAVPRRLQALRLFRRIMKEGKNWSNPDEREYIFGEARELFRKNQGLKNPAEIDAKIFEAESRLELALHYKIPYPRQFYVARSTTAKKKVVDNPYMHSYMHDSSSPEDTKGSDSSSSSKQ